MGNTWESGPEKKKENPKIQTCPSCAGTGKNKEGKPCSPCDGTGKIRANR